MSTVRVEPPTQPNASAVSGPRSAYAVLALAFAILIGFNLRPGITSISPFLSHVAADASLSPFLLGILTTLPIICLGAFGLLASRLSRSYGVLPTLLVAVLAVVIGINVRNLQGPNLFVGTALIGIGMCFMGVLAPVFIKQSFPRRFGAAMGLYSAFIGLGGVLSVGMAAPFAAYFGGDWPAVLMVWSFPAVVALLVGISLLLGDAPFQGAMNVKVTGVEADLITWQITGYFTTVAALAYAVIVWGPAILTAAGLDQESAGLALAVSYASQMLTGFIASFVAGKVRDQRLLGVLFAILTMVGFAGILFAPAHYAVAACAVLGLGQGGAFSLAISLIVLRTKHPAIAAKVSGLAQTVGYIVGGLAGPFAIGMVHAWTGTWQATTPIVVAVIGASALFAISAGRNRTISAEVSQATPKGLTRRPMQINP